MPAYQDSLLLLRDFALQHTGGTNRLAPELLRTAVSARTQPFLSPPETTLFDTIILRKRTLARMQRADALSALCKFMRRAANGRYTAVEGASALGVRCKTR